MNSIDERRKREEHEAEQRRRRSNDDDGNVVDAVASIISAIPDPSPTFTTPDPTPCDSGSSVDSGGSCSVDS